MILYEVLINERDARAQFVVRYPNVLVSYFFVTKGLKKLFSEVSESAENMFLDSGAHSANTTGAEIDLDQYIQFIHDHKDLVTNYANLDVIGNWRKTLENQKTMEASGLSPVPTFHHKEPWKVLEEYLEKYEYLALGGVVGISRSEKMGWLGEVWGRIAPWRMRRRVHMFGVSDRTILLRFPFYSADASSGSLQSVFGTRPVDGRVVHYTRLGDCRTLAAYRAARVEIDSEVSLTLKTMDRFVSHLRARMGFQKLITDAWKARGVEWE